MSAEPSLDADNSFKLWTTDLDLVRSFGLNSYRFSLEWARIEPEPRLFSIAMLDHYKAMIQGCRARGLMPVVTFCSVDRKTFKRTPKTQPAGARRHRKSQRALKSFNQLRKAHHAHVQ